MPLAILAVLILAAWWIAWKGVGRNQGTVEQQHVDPRRPFEHRGEHTVGDHDQIPSSPTGEPLFDLGSGVYAEWWRVVDPDHPDYPNDPGRVYGVVEHHWCVSDVDVVPGVTEYWAMGSVPTMASAPVKWTIEAGEPEKFEGLTLSPSILCKRCGLHGWIREGRWVPA